VSPANALQVTTVCVKTVAAVICRTVALLHAVPKSTRSPMTGTRGAIQIAFGHGNELHVRPSSVVELTINGSSRVWALATLPILIAKANGIRQLTDLKRSHSPVSNDASTVI
jgi:hypothetical protein